MANKILVSLRLSLALVAIAGAAIAGAATVQAGNGDRDRSRALTKHPSETRRYAAVRRDCRPFNGPYGYYGNPWCEGGWLRSEDRPPHWWYGPAGRYR